MTAYDLETYKSRISLAIEIIKLLATVNGGGAIAVLTFAGHTKLDAAALWASLVSFSVGLVLAVLTAFGAYVIQALMDEARALQIETLRITRFAVSVVSLFVIASVSAFGVGCLLAAEAISAAETATRT